MPIHDKERIKYGRSTLSESNRYAVELYEKW